MPPKAKKNARQQIRFKPDEGLYAQLDLDAESKEFSPTLAALILNESHGGCALVIVNPPKLKAGAVLRAQVGQLAPMKAEVRWMKTLDDEVAKLGLQYLE